MTSASSELYSPIRGAYHEAMPVTLLRAFIDQCSPPTWNQGMTCT